VRELYAAFLSGDRAALEGLLSEDFTFTSPRDDHLDKATYFERCFPNHDQFRAHRIDKLFVSGDEAFVRYRAETKDGARFRNAEYVRLEGGKVREVEVYFGSA
jgi:ketosteroid isomerase-like protein